MLPISPFFTVFGLMCGHGLLPDCRDMQCAGLLNIYQCYQEGRFYRTEEYETALKLGHNIRVRAVKK